MKSKIIGTEHVIDEGKEWFIVNLALKLSKERYLKLLKHEKNKEVSIVLESTGVDTNQRT